VQKVRRQSELSCVTLAISAANVQYSAEVSTVQSFPSVIEAPDFDMGQRETSTLLERLTSRVTALEKLLPKSSSDNGKWVAWAALIVAIISLIALPISVASWIEPHLHNDLKNDTSIEVTSQLKDPIKQIGDMAGDIKEIKGKLEVLDPMIRELMLKRIGEIGKLDSRRMGERVPELKQLATLAKKEGVSIPPTLVKNVATKLAAIGSADAWTAALDFATYKSFLNAANSIRLTQLKGQLPSQDLYTVYLSVPPPGMTPPVFSVVGGVPKEQAATFSIIGAPDLNAKNLLGNDWIILDGNGIVLDKLKLKKVIFRNVYISYSGGPLEMEDVYFLNCTFGVSQHPNGELLLTKVLDQSTAVKFNAS
jgi:hypothetical protein